MFFQELSEQSDWINLIKISPSIESTKSASLNLHSSSKISLKKPFLYFRLQSNALIDTYKNHFIKTYHSLTFLNIKNTGHIFAIRRSFSSSSSPFPLLAQTHSLYQQFRANIKSENYSNVFTNLWLTRMNQLTQLKSPFPLRLKHDYSIPISNNQL